MCPLLPETALINVCSVKYNKTGLSLCVPHFWKTLGISVCRMKVKLRELLESLMWVQMLLWFLDIQNRFLIMWKRLIEADKRAQKQEQEICCNCVTVYLTRELHHVLSAWSPRPSILNSKDNTAQKQGSPWASMLIDFPRSLHYVECMQTTSLWIFGFPHHSNRAAKPCCTTSHQTQLCLGIARRAGVRWKGDKKRKKRAGKRTPLPCT